MTNEAMFQAMLSRTQVMIGDDEDTATTIRLIRHLGGSRFVAELNDMPGAYEAAELTAA